MCGRPRASHPSCFARRTQRTDMVEYFGTQLGGLAFTLQVCGVLCVPGVVCRARTARRIAV
jgi:methionine synthase II (cobalamin-independent)